MRRRRERPFAGRLPGWTPGKHSGAYLASPQMPGAVFSMVLVKMNVKCIPAPPLPGVERFIFLIQGEVKGVYTDLDGAFQAFTLSPGEDQYAFFPAGIKHGFHATKEDTVILMYEQVYRPHPQKNGTSPAPVVGNVDEQKMLDPGAPEVFGLRKLLPLSEEYDFNIHVMDFEPGQYLHCNEMHYNQHGMLMLEVGVHPRNLTPVVYIYMPFTLRHVRGVAAQVEFERHI